jgi:hypothetical protein
MAAFWLGLGVEAFAAQDPPAASSWLSLRGRMQPVAKDSGFRMPGYFVWCASVIRVGETYQMFAARWPVDTRFPDGYRQHSEIVRATSTRPEGPYQFQEVVIGKRAPGKWDSAMAHNPAIYKTGKAYVLFYIGSDEGSSYRRIGYASAAAVTGPWIRNDQPLDLGIASDANNPAACFDPDGSLKLIWRDADLKVYLSTAPSYQGPYRVANNRVWHDTLEDFFLFKCGGQYHLLCEDDTGRITGHDRRWGAHLCSADGIDGWKECSPPAAYDNEIHWTDGTVFHPVRRERPWLLLENGAATYLFTAVFDGSQTWNQPVPIRPAYRAAP